MVGRLLARQRHGPARPSPRGGRPPAPTSHEARARRVPRGTPGARHPPGGQPDRRATRDRPPRGSGAARASGSRARSGAPAITSGLLTSGCAKPASSRSSSTMSSSTLRVGAGPVAIRLASLRLPRRGAEPFDDLDQLTHVHAPLPLRRPHGPADDLGLRDAREVEQRPRRGRWSGRPGGGCGHAGRERTSDGRRAPAPLGWRSRPRSPVGWRACSSTKPQSSAADQWLSTRGRSTRLHRGEHAALVRRARVADRPDAAWSRCSGHARRDARSRWDVNPHARNSAVESTPHSSPGPLRHLAIAPSVEFLSHRRTEVDARRAWEHGGGPGRAWGARGVAGRWRARRGRRTRRCGCPRGRGRPR